MLNQYVRYEPVLRLIRALGGGTVLDVGSGSEGVARWLPGDWRVTAVDRSFDDYGTAAGAAGGAAEHLVADARALPFRDGAFDVVLALDLLEHVPAADRPVVLAELARAARRRLIVACPAGEPALAADKRLAAWYVARSRPLPGWLVEHVAHGFPAPAELAEGLRGRGRLRMLGNENVHAHLLLMRLEAGRFSRHATVALGRLVRPALTGSRAAGAAMRLLRAWDRPPTYRVVAVVDRG